MEKQITSSNMDLADSQSLTKSLSYKLEGPEIVACLIWGTVCLQEFLRSQSGLAKKGINKQGKATYSGKRAALKNSQTPDFYMIQGFSYRGVLHCAFLEYSVLCFCPSRRYPMGFGHKIAMLYKHAKPLAIRNPQDPAPILRQLFDKTWDLARSGFIQIHICRSLCIYSSQQDILPLKNVYEPFLQAPQNDNWADAEVPRVIQYLRGILGVLVGIASLRESFCHVKLLSSEGTLPSRSCCFIRFRVYSAEKSSKGPRMSMHGRLSGCCNLLTACS